MIRATSTILVLRSKGSWTTNTHVEVVVATSEDGLASGNAEHGPRDVAGVRRRGKEHEGGCDLTGLASPSDRCVTAEFLEVMRSSVPGTRQNCTCR